MGAPEGSLSDPEVSFNALFGSGIRTFLLWGMCLYSVLWQGSATAAVPQAVPLLLCLASIAGHAITADGTPRAFPVSCRSLREWQCAGGEEAPGKPAGIQAEGRQTAWAALRIPVALRRVRTPAGSPGGSRQGDR